MIRVRRATLADVPFVLEQSREFDHFFGGKHSLFPTAEVAEAKLQLLIETQVFLIAENDAGPVGFIAGVLSPNFFNDAIQQLTEIMWWVAPEHRGSRAGLLLLDEFNALGAKLAHQIWMTLEDKSPVNPKTLTRRGFRPKESSWLREIA